MLVFGKDDQQLEILASVVGRLNWNVSIAKNLETAVQIFQNRFHDLVIVDHRGSRGQEAVEICRFKHFSPIHIFIISIKMYHIYGFIKNQKYYSDDFFQI